LVPGIKEFLKGLPENLTAFMPALGGGAGQVFTFLSGAAGLLFGAILVLVVSFYIALQEKWVENSLRTLAPRRYEEYLIGLWKRTERKIGRWFYAQMILSSLVGTLTFVGLSIVGIQHAALIALITAAFSIVPIAGSLFAGIIAFIVAVQQGLDLGIYTIILFVLIQQLEAYALSPLLHKRALGLNPVMVVFAILIGTRIAGFWGIIIAIPLAAAIAEFWSDIDERRQLNV
jgi:predicted PurR-regulated permease PerM